MRPPSQPSPPKPAYTSIKPDRHFNRTKSRRVCTHSTQLFSRILVSTVSLNYIQGRRNGICLPFSSTHPSPYVCLPLGPGVLALGVGLAFSSLSWTNFAATLTQRSKRQLHIISFSSSERSFSVASPSHSFRGAFCGPISQRTRDSACFLHRRTSNTREHPEHIHSYTGFLSHTVTSHRRVTERRNGKQPEPRPQ